MGALPPRSRVLSAFAVCRHFKDSCRWLPWHVVLVIRRKRVGANAIFYVQWNRQRTRYVDAELYVELQIIVGGVGDFPQLARFRGRASSPPFTVASSFGWIRLEEREWIHSQYRNGGFAGWRGDVVALRKQDQRWAGITGGIAAAARCTILAAEERGGRAVVRTIEDCRLRPAGQSELRTCSCNSCC